VIEEDVASSGAEEAAAPARLPTQPGDLVAEKYEVERILGAGGMGIVVSAVHPDLPERGVVRAGGERCSDLAGDDPGEQDRRRLHVGAV